MENLFCCLRAKIPKKHAFKKLIEVLQETMIEDYIQLAQKVNDTHTTADASLVAKVDPSYYNRKIRQILIDHFTNKEGAEILLSNIRKKIQENDGFSDGFDWSNKQLGDFLCEHFVGVNILKRKERCGKKNITREYVQNVAEKQRSGKEVTRALSPAHTREDHDVKSFNPSRLKSFLQNRFQKEGLSVEPLDQLEKEDISGRVLLTMTESDLQMVMPSASFGARRTIRTIIDEHKYSQTSSNISYPQRVRDFDIDVQPGDFYTQGSCVDVDIQIRGKTTNRIKNFHSLVDQTQHHITEYAAVEVVLFAAACINGRRNGTIYFGISPEKTQRHQAGEVVGISVSKEELQREVDVLLSDAFHKRDKTAIQGTIRPAMFVPITFQGDRTAVNENREKTFVIEYDIVPTSDILGDHSVKIKLKRIPHLYKKFKSPDGVVQFSDEGKPRLLKETELYRYEAEKQKIFTQRKTDETIKQKGPQQNLRQQLYNLLTGGHTVIEDDIFVVLGPLDEMERNCVLSSMSFLKHLHPEVVFDFDGKGSSDGIYHFLDDNENLVTRVLTVDDFKPKQGERDKINELALTLRREKHTCWVFCNGYEETEMLSVGCTDWNKTRRNAFTDVLKAFLDIVHKDNISVLFCLFSSNYEVMLEASEEIVLKLPNQWVLLAESDKVASMWQQTMLQRHRIDKSDALERSVIEMTWQQINRCIIGWCDIEEVVNVEIPQSNGSFISVSEKTINSWSDIEVVSAADHVNGDKNDEKHQLKVKKLEEEFYQGAQVKFLNFWYHDQVCVRNVHDDLKKNVENALQMQRKDEEVKINHVYFNHQPGAGGTTSAKQVLWCLRKDYRCCVVKDITEQTCTQLKDIYLYEDKNPKPLIVLLDNLDEDKFEALRADLDMVTRDLQTEMQEELSIFCVLLVCVRCTALTPAKRKARMTFLKQELKIQELEWFEKKSKELESRFSNDTVGNVNPKFLISFNILKENFNQEYIANVVKEFTDEISDEKEQLILKYVSLLNTYDIHFTAIPIGCFDRVLQNTNMASKHYPLRKKVESEVNWETNVSQGLTLLLNVSSKKRRHIPKTIRVFHKLIADEILKRMKIISGQSESEIMNDLLESVFDYEDRDSKEIQKIITIVIRKRPYKKDDPTKRELFSSLILSIKKNEGDEKANAILKSLYIFDQDPFTAQQIARSYLELKNFREAERYAKYATDKLPSNSFLWDTYGQVYKNQLFDKIDSERSQVNHSGFTKDDINEFIELYQKSVQYFKKEQNVSEEEMNVYSGKDNFAGYFNELRCILLLLSCLEKCSLFDSKEDLHDYLVSETLTQHSGKFSKSLDKKERDCIKGLYSSAKQTMQKLEEEFLQRKSKFAMDKCDASEEEYFFNQYTFMKKSMYEFFGETTNHIRAKSVSEEEQCMHRYRRARTLGASSLQSLLNLARTNGCDDKFKEVYDLLLPNVNSKFCCFDFLKTMLDIVLILNMKEKTSEISFTDVLEWSYELYSAEDCNKVNPSLEKYLYFILFHFPTEERKQYAIQPPFELSKAIDLWKSTYDKKYHKNGKKETTHRKETTLFFLGKGDPLHDLVYQDLLTDIMESHSRAQKWYLPQVLHVLRLMSGTLLEGGHTIKYYFETSDGNRQHLSIQTSCPIRHRNWWQKKVYFFVGFSFLGPKAYGICAEKPREPIGSNAPVYRKNLRQSKRCMTPVKDNSLAELKAKEAEIVVKIKRRKGANCQQLESQLEEIRNKISEHLLGEMY